MATIGTYSGRRSQAPTSISKELNKNIKTYHLKIENNMY